MDELTVTLRARMKDGEAGGAGKSDRRLVLFDRPERYTLTTAVEAVPMAAVEVGFPPGADFLLHGFVLRDSDGRDLYRWAGAGELFREMRGLRLSSYEGAVRVEAVAEPATITVGLGASDPKTSVQVLLTLSSARKAAGPLPPDELTVAIEQLHVRIDDLDAREGERHAELVAQSQLQDERARAQYAEAHKVMAAAEVQYAEARQVIAEGQAQYADARQAIADSQEQFAEAQAQYRAGQRRLNAFGRQLAVVEGQHAGLVAHVDRRAAETQEVVIQALNAFRHETQQQHHAVLAQVQQEQARALHAENQLAQARELALAQASRIAALETSTSWRLTAPLRVAVRLATGKVTPGGVMHRLRNYRRPGVGSGLVPTEPPVFGEPAEARHEPRPAQFPLAGAAATLGELSQDERRTLPLKVSVIIPTYNAGHEFHWLLRKLQGQKGLAGVEVVVVDSGSSDGTDTLAEQFGCTVVRIPNSEFSHSHARNLGADNASGDLYLFTVQDAYPVGDWWLHSLALALTEPASEDERAAAVSCSEFPRVDSELLYNAAIDTHYRFLGCRDGDRLGRYEDDDGHMSLRVQGQLSDVACLIPAETFHKYRYQGRYAEDLILGVRLIKDGLKTAMLASLKVIHSHNRPTGYHLKRTFVDVVFLTEVFPDFPIPHAASPAGAAAAAAALDALVADWRPAVDVDAAEELRAFSRRVRALPMDDLKPVAIDFGFTALTPWLEDAIAREKTPGIADAEQLRNMFADRLDHLASFVGRTYGPLDAYLAGELATAARKTLAATLGAQLSFLYLSQAKKGDKARRKRVDDLRTLMTAGI